MEEDDKYIARNALLDWMEGNAHGRKVLALVIWLQRVWHLHIDRYRLWDETVYRVCTWLVVIAFSAIVAETSYLGWRFYRHHEEIRSQVEAQAYLAHGDTRNASLSADRALLFNPNNLGACRVMAALAEQTHSASALDWLGRIAHNQPTIQNQLRLALAAMNYQPPPFQFTAEMLQQMAPIASNNADYQVAVATLEMNLRHLSVAEQHFATAARLDPANHYSVMSMALLQLVSTNRAERSQAVATLEQMRTNDDVGIFALRGLVTDRLAHNDLSAAEVYSSQLVSRSQINLSDRLQNLGILHQLASPEFPASLRAVEQQVMGNETAIAEVSAWMRNNGLTDENLDWMMQLPNSMLNRPQIQMNRAQGYLQTSNWARLRQVASEGDWGDLEYSRFALVSHACSEMGEGEMADSNWQSAMKDSSVHLSDMIKLLNLAESWNLKHEREQLLLWMVKDFPDQRWEEKLVDIYSDAGNTLGLHQLYGILFEYFPTNTVCQNRLAATELLLKIHLEEAYDLAEESYSKDPTNAAIVSTYAYSLHLQDRDLQGIDAMKNLPPSQLDTPYAALYYGVLLASAGKPGEAKTWLNFARQKGHFLPEERMLLDGALSQITPPSPASAHN